MQVRNYNLEGIVLKRTNLGETDRLVTLVSQEQGKFVCLAKGARKLNSSKGSYLEPGNIIKAFLVNTKSLPLLIQARLIDDGACAKTNLTQIRQMMQVLEVFDKLLVEQELEPQTYQLILKIRQSLILKKTSTIRSSLNKLILQLGFPATNFNKHLSVSDYIQEIADRPMKSFEYLMP